MNVNKVFLFAELVPLCNFSIVTCLSCFVLFQLTSLFGREMSSTLENIK